MGNYTPGPWIVGECAAGLFFEVRPEQQPSDSGLFQITDTCPSMYGRDGGNHIHGGEQEANARLIAAAPDLLEALKNMMPERTGYGNSMDWNEYNKAVKKARAAIAKALGENNV